MSDFFVMLVFKTVIYKSKLLDFRYFASLELEHYKLNTNFRDRHKLRNVFISIIILGRKNIIIFLY